LHNGIPVLPQGGNTDTTTAQQHNGHRRDDEIVVPFGLIHGGGHLVVHNTFSYIEMINPWPDYIR
jgi:hypothetical protein